MPLSTLFPASVHESIRLATTTQRAAARIAAKANTTAEKAYRTAERAAQGWLHGVDDRSNSTDSVMRQHRPALVGRSWDDAEVQAAWKRLRAESEEMHKVPSFRAAARYADQEHQGARAALRAAELAHISLLCATKAMADVQGCDLTGCSQAVVIDGALVVVREEAKARYRVAACNAHGILGCSSDASTARKSFGKYGAVITAIRPIVIIPAVS